MPDLTREEYLQSVFSREWTFVHRTQEFTYVPIPISINKPLLVGKIGRRYVTQVDEPPEKKFRSSSVSGWKSAYLIIDPTDVPGGDGQRIAFQVVDKVGKPHAVLPSFTTSINADMNTPYHVEAQPLPQAEHFRAWLSGRELESIRLTHVTPNGWFGTRNSVRTGLTRIRNDTGAKTVSTTLTSKDGPLNSESETIKQSIEYIGSTGGEIWAKDKSGKTFNSKNNQSHTRLKVEIDEVLDEESLLLTLLKNIAPIMKRD